MLQTVFENQTYVQSLLAFITKVSKRQSFCPEMHMRNKSYKAR